MENTIEQTVEDLNGETAEHVTEVVNEPVVEGQTEEIIAE